jgi:selT/selW/selH-like putative selenoprotein
VSLAGELLSLWAPVLGGVDLKTGSHGRFEVALDGHEVFSKEKLDRFPAKGEVAKLLGEMLGNPPPWRATGS